jgi:hypothetical protein
MRFKPLQAPTWRKTDVKTSLLLIPLTTLLASCSGDIRVKSELGEVKFVKGSLITVYPFDKNKAENNLMSIIKSIEEKKAGCEKLPHPGLPLEKRTPQAKKEQCEKYYGYDGLIKVEKKRLETVRSMPDFMMVNFPVITTDINGFKKVGSDFTYACLPDTSKVDSEQYGDWLDVYELAEPDEFIMSASMNSWSDGIADKVCQWHGKF